MDALTKKFKDYRSPDLSFEAESDSVDVREEANVGKGFGKHIEQV